MKKKFYQRIFHDFGRFKKLFLIMRLSFIMLLVSSLTVIGNSYSQSTKFSFQLSKATIKDVFQEIEQNSEFIIVYSDDMIDVSREVSVKVADVTVERILDQVLKESGNGYEIKDRQIVITEHKSLPLDGLMAQKHELKGVVKTTDGSPLPGATVIEKGTTNGTITDFDGKFTLTVSKSPAVVSFSFVGYTTIDMDYKGQATLDVVLQEESIGIEEVVAVGYGVQRKSDLTGATNRLSDKDMNKSLATSPVEMMQGRIAGVNITQNNGEPGGGMTVRVRGSSSIRSGQEPLYVVDGIPLDNSNLTPSGGTAAGYGSGGSKNPLGFINPEDIESIDILKDASSTAIYGARGANGVVLVTTKKGKKGESTITFDSYIGTSTIREKMNVLSPDQFRSYTRANGSKLLDLGASINWQDEIFRTAITQNQALGLSGGTDKSTYHLSLGYLDQQGIVNNSGIKKLNGSIKLTQKAFSDKLLLTASLLASQQEDSRMPISEASGSGYEGDLIITALKSNPTFPIYNANGTYYQHTTDQRNPVAMMNLVDDKVNTLRVVANMSAEYEIIKGLKYKLNVGLDRANADVVSMASYAPLFGNVNAWQWRPDLIWFDNLKSAATPNYYVQKMFSTNAGTDVVSALVDGKPLTGPDSLFASACIDSKTSELIVKMVNVAKKPTTLTLLLDGKQSSAKEISLQVITNLNPAAFNQVGKPEEVVPVERKQKISGKKITMNLDGYSLTVARIAIKK